ncbi:hypothetical protein PoB_000349900 [Plakobranchus ocellatus]|uniref:Uncharacterized protein n=1 Tax=Plakobranchus ocellatus TaxID=259542 RepID=A0AAV3Y225_9GAST|nr:hypothetical protein PoB_000349900 [Plakobranchus ocellatus]
MLLRNGRRLRQPVRPKIREAYRSHHGHYVPLMRVRRNKREAIAFGLLDAHGQSSLSISIPTPSLRMATARRQRIIQEWREENIRDADNRRQRERENERNARRGNIDDPPLAEMWRQLTDRRRQFSIDYDMNTSYLGDYLTNDFNWQRLNEARQIDRQTHIEDKRHLCKGYYLKLADRLVAGRLRDENGDDDDGDPRDRQLVRVAAIVEKCNICRNFSYPITTGMVPETWMLTCDRSVKYTRMY